MTLLNAPVLIVRVDDWAAIYDGDESVCQGHTIRLYDLQFYLKGHTTLDMIKEVGLDATPVEKWAFMHGRLPEYRSEVLKILGKGVDAVQ